jgi:hypothetical protein
VQFCLFLAVFSLSLRDLSFRFGLCLNHSIKITLVTIALTMAVTSWDMNSFLHSEFIFVNCMYCWQITDI